MPGATSQKKKLQMPLMVSSEDKLIENSHGKKLMIQGLKQRRLLFAYHLPNSHSGAMVVRAAIFQHALGSHSPFNRMILFENSFGEFDLPGGPVHDHHQNIADALQYYVREATDIRIGYTSDVPTVSRMRYFDNGKILNFWDEGAPAVTTTKWSETVFTVVMDPTFPMGDAFGKWVTKKELDTIPMVMEMREVAEEAFDSMERKQNNGGVKWEVFDV